MAFPPVVSYMDKINITAFSEKSFVLLYENIA
jgi:hypothetical protein